MKKNLLACVMLTMGLTAIAQSPRVSLYEEFTGETCPPCASTNPGLNIKLLSATNATRIVAIKWQVPIPSAPSNTWSLYKTNQAEIDWRYRSIANGGYGYIPAVTSAPSGKIDGQGQTVFGATSNHPTYMSDAIIATAASYSSAFNIMMTRDVITSTSTAAVVNVTITATAPYSTSSSLVFRNVMVERLITFSVQSGTNGEKIFEDAARKSYPTLQSGTSLPGTWTQGQTMTFSMNCVFPTYIRNNLEIEFVGFIQNDGTQKVEQTTRTDMPSPAFDAVAFPVTLPLLCNVSNTMSPNVSINNNGQSAITAMTITPYVDGIAKNVTQWTGNLAAGSSTSIALDAFSSSTVNGSHTFSYNITSLNGLDNNLGNNGASGKYYGVANYQATPIVEDFLASGFPYAGWTINNSNNGTATWKHQTGVEGFNVGSGNSMKYDFFNNTAINDKDELFLPPLDLTGVGVPVMSFDLAYKLKSSTSSDKLELMLSDNCGSSWTSVWNGVGTALAANQTPEPSSAYLATAIEDWQTVQVFCTGFNKPNVLAKFVVTNKNGNNLYLDNINLAKSNIPDGLGENNLSNINITVFPNPNNGITNVQIASVKNQSAKLTVINTLGQIVLEKQLNLNAGINNSIIDLTSVSNGIYSLNIEGGNVKSVSRVSINK